MEKHFSEAFYIAFVSVLLSGKQQLIAVGEQNDLTLMQTATLLVLAGVEELSMSSFSRLFACDASNVTGIIDGLENKKLVSRRPHPSDRRIKMICLEAAGRRMQKQLVKQLALNSESLFSILSPTEQQQLSKLVFKLSDGIREAEGGICPRTAEHQLA